MNISIQNYSKITQNNTQNISFGKNYRPQNLDTMVKGGETYVVVSDSFYFKKFKPKELLRERFVKKDAEQKKSPIRSYFLPFRRINQMSNNTNDVRYSGGCQIITAVSDKDYNRIKELTQFSADKRANFWLPNMILNKKSGRLNLHWQDNIYRPISNKFTPSDNTPLKSIVNCLLDKIDKKQTSDLVVAIGSRVEDLAFVNPFYRLGIDMNEPNAFNKIKDLPFRSAFICNKRTPKKLREQLLQIEKFANSDGKLRFAIIDAEIKTPINKIAHAILLLQRSFANYSGKFRKTISNNLNNVLMYRNLEHERFDTTPKWAKKTKNEKASLSKSIINFFMSNKITTGLLLTALIVPTYFKYFYDHNKSK